MKNNPEEDKKLDREIFLENRKSRMDEFRRCIDDIKNKFSIAALFGAIREQEKFIIHIKKSGHKLTNYKDEKKVLDIMIDETKVVFKDYEKTYNEYDLGLEKD
jgi:hypothetical protein